MKATSLKLLAEPSGSFEVEESSFSRIATVSRALEKDLVTLVTYRTYIALLSFVHSQTRQGMFPDEPATDFEDLDAPGKPGVEHETR